MWSENGTEFVTLQMLYVPDVDSNINTCQTIDKTNNHTSDKEIENGDWKLFQEIEKGDSNIVRLKLISKD